MDPFFSLSSGAKFNKKKFQEETQLFKLKKLVEVNKGTALLESSKLPSEIDFFNTTTTTSKKRTETKSTSVASIPNQQEEEPTESLDPIKTKKEADTFRAQYKIRVYGSDIPYPIQNFSELFQKKAIPTFLRDNLRKLPYTDLTPIQKQAIPIQLEKRDFLACAPTGTGKTMAFAIPTIYNLQQPSKEGCRVLIVSPTRELASQIHNQFLHLVEGTNFKVVLLSKAMVASFKQAPELRPKSDILVTTPLRLVHLIKEEKMDLSKVTQLVLDEADKLFELGFLEQIDDIVAACKAPTIHKALFSATIPSGVESLASSIMNDPCRVVVGTKDGATEMVAQELVYAGQESGKLIGLRRVIKEGFKPPAIVFVQSAERAEQLYRELVYDNLKVDVIHAEKSQTQRDEIVSRFLKGETWILIATDLLARGLDFRGVNLVVNYDFPQSVQSYVHRIGRTGRAGRTGKAVTFFTDVDAEYLRSVANVMSQSGCSVPEWMLKLKKTSQSAKKQLKRKPLERDEISSIASEKKRIHKSIKKPFLKSI